MMNFILGILATIIGGLSIYIIKRLIERKGKYKLVSVHEIEYLKENEVMRLMIKIINDGETNVIINKVTLEGTDYKEDIYFNGSGKSIKPGESLQDRYSLEKTPASKINKIVIYYNGNKSKLKRINLQKEIEIVEKEICI